MPTVDAILRIDDAFLNKIAEADKRIVELGETAQRTAQRVNNAFAYTMVDGVQSFINAVKAAKHELAGLTMPSMGSVASTASVTALTSAITPLIAEIGKLNTSFGALTSAGGGTHIVFADASKAILSFRAALTSLGLSMDDANKKMQELINLRTPASPTPARSIAEIDASSRKVIISLAELQKNYNDLSKIMANSDPKTKQWSEAALAIDYTANRLREYSQQQKNAQQGAMSLADSMSRLSSTNLQSMGAHDLQQTISNLKTALDNISRTSMGGVTAEWQRLNALLQQAQSELQKIRELEKPRTTPTSNSDLITMANDTRFYAQSLSELKKLQDDLYKAISRMPRTPVDPAMQAELKQLRDGYKAVTKEIADFEKTLKEVKMPTGLTARPFTDIVNAATTAYVPLEQLKVDLKAVQAELAKMSMADQRTFNPALFQQLSQSAQDLANHIAYLNREQKGLNATMQGNAAMGRLAAEGFDGIKRSILSVDTPIKQLERDLSDLRTIFRNTSPNDAQYLKYAQAIRIVEERVRRLREAEKSGATRNIGISELIRDANKAGASLQQLMAVQQRMKNELSKMNPNTQDWARLNDEYQKLIRKTDEIRKKMGDLQQSTKKSGLSFQQLGQYIALAFSVQAIQGFLKKMVEAHAQMQLQRVALRALIQEKEQADKVYNAVQQMALQSPFTIAQLTTYTKQLGAYRIETEKLVGTTKMLADVSAGLGVDMQRLILAFGQVKSANYLRATEVRQFTEAGLNIAGELANLFSELEGRGVSVADVMDRITRRMVKFEDVEEVFKRVTNAGGLFYDMQKKQSESVYGQMQRIQDAITLMYDDIGRGNASIIGGVLTTIRELIANWRAVQTTILSVVGIFALYKSAQLGAFLIGNKELKKFIISLKSAQGATAKLLVGMRALKSVAVGLGSIGVMAAITGLIYLFEKWRTESNKLKEELKQINDEIGKDRTQSINRLRELLDIVNSTNESYSRQQEALGEIQRTYKDIFTSTQLEQQNVSKLAENWDATTAAVNNYYANKMRRQQEEKIYANFQEQLQGNIEDIGNNSVSLTKNGKTTSYKVGENITRAIVEGMIAELQRGNLVIKTQDAFVTEFSNRLSKYYGGAHVDIFGGFVKNLNEIFNDYIAMQYKVNAIDTSLIGSTSGMTEFNRLLEERNNLMQQYETLLGEVQKKTTQGQTIPSGLIAEINNIRQSLGLMDTTADKLIAVTKTEYDFTNAMASFRTASWQTFSNEMQRRKDLTKQEKEQIADLLKSRKEAADLTNTQRVVQQAKKSISEAYNVAISVFDQIKVDSKASVTQIIKETEGIKEANLKAIESYKTAYAEFSDVRDKTQIMKPGMTAEEWAFDATGYTKEQIDNFEKLSMVIDYFIKMLGGTPKAPKGGKGEDRFANMATMLKSINTEYNKLLKYYDAETAKAKVLASYREAIAETFKDTFYEDADTWFGVDDEIISNIAKTLAENADKKAGKRALLKFSAEIDAELDIKNQEQSLDNLKKNIDKLFANYELTKDFADLGMNIDLVYMFGGKPITLEGLRQEAEKMYNDIYKFKNNKDEQGYQNALNEYNAMLKKIEALELKSAIARQKNWAKVTLESMGERAQIMLKTQREINKIMESDDFDDATKSLMKEQLLKKQQQELDKQAWSSFKSSDFYISMFEDMEHHSSQYIDIMIKQLEELKDSLKGLPADQVRAIVKEIEKLKNIKQERNPFATFIEGLKELKKNAIEYKNTIENIKNLLSQKSVVDNDVTEQELLVESLRNQYESTKAMFGAQSDAAKKAQAAYEKALETLGILKKEQKKINDELDAENEKENKIVGAIGKIQRGWEGVWKYIDEFTNGLGDILNGLDEMVGVSQALKDNFESLTGILGGLQEAGSGLFNGVTGILASNPLQAAQGGMQLAKGVVKIAKGIAQIGDKKKERQINKLKDRVYELSQAYEQLHKSIERAYAMDDFVLGNRQAKKNLEAQIRSYEQILQLEKDKKKTDKDKVREYEEKLVELKDKLEDLRNEELKALGGFGSDDRLSAAESFASAWLSAYKETGDGLDALSEQWDEYIDNLIVKQASLRIVGKRMKKFFDMVDLALDEKSDEGENLSEKEAAKIAALRKELLDSTNKDLKAFVDALGLTRKGTAKLSDLQMGISNITEEQAAALEAITNSIRFGVYQQLEVLNQIAAILRTQYGGSNNGALLEEVRAIKSLLMRIDSRFNSITATKSGVGSYLKVG